MNRLGKLFSGVDWAPFEEIMNRLYSLEGRRPKPPIAYFRANENEEEAPLQAFSLKGEIQNANWHIADSQRRAS